MLAVYHRGRGHEPVTVAGSIKSFVAVNAIGPPVGSTESSEREFARIDQPTVALWLDHDLLLIEPSKATSRICYQTQAGTKGGASMSSSRR